MFIFNYMDINNAEKKRIEASHHKVGIQGFFFFSSCAAQYEHALTPSASRKSVGIWICNERTFGDTDSLYGTMTCSQILFCFVCVVPICMATCYWNTDSRALSKWLLWTDSQFCFLIMLNLLHHSKQDMMAQMGQREVNYLWSFWHAPITQAVTKPCRTQIIWDRRRKSFHLPCHGTLLCTFVFSETEKCSW